MSQHVSFNSYLLVNHGAVCKHVTELEGLSVCYCLELIKSISSFRFLEQSLCQTLAVCFKPGVYFVSFRLLKVSYTLDI